MALWTLTAIENAIRAAWGADTCEPQYRHRWHPGNPARGQGGITALLVQDLLGGELLLGEVFVDGIQTEYQWWNRFAPGTELDLTRHQFGPEETVTRGRAVARPADPGRLREGYELLRSRVLPVLDGERAVGRIIR